MRTPKKKRTLIILTAIYWVAAPFVEATYYRIEQLRGSYPVYADSIIIPIFEFFIIWLIVYTPLAVIYVRWFVRPYPGAVPFLAFNRQRPLLACL